MNLRYASLPSSYSNSIDQQTRSIDLQRSTEASTKAPPAGGGIVNEEIYGGQPLKNKGGISKQQ